MDPRPPDPTRPPAPPPAYYPPPPGYYQPPPDPHKNARVAGLTVFWLWMLGIMIPVFLLLACAGICVFGGFLGSAGPFPSASPS